MSSIVHRVTVAEAPGVGAERKLNKVDRQAIGQSEAGSSRSGLLAPMGLHLLPGLLAVLFYSLLVLVLAGNGLPAIAAMLLATLFILVPFELELVLYLLLALYHLWQPYAVLTMLLSF